MKLRPRRRVPDAQHDPARHPSLLRRIPLFSGTVGGGHPAGRATRERQVARGEVLFQRGDLPHGFYFVVSGQVKLAFSSSQGTPKVVEIIGPMQSFGEAVMFMNHPTRSSPGLSGPCWCTSARRW